MKVIIFDASTLITLSMNGLLPEFRELKKNFDGHFIIPKEVKHEIIEKPLKIKRFELEAMRAEQLLKDGVLEMPSVLGIKDSEISKKTKQIFDMANTTFIGKKSPIHLIDSGECGALALSEILNKKKIPNLIAVDERTTRSLIEDPEDMRKFLEKKLHTKIVPKKANYPFFKQFKIIRSAELIYIANKKGLVRLKHKDVLDALLYALKFKGCSISHEEIREIKRLK